MRRPTLILVLLVAIAAAPSFADPPPTIVIVADPDPIGPVCIIVEDPEPILGRRLFARDGLLSRLFRCDSIHRPHVEPPETSDNLRRRERPRRRIASEQTE